MKEVVDLDEFDLEVISQTSKPSGGMIRTLVDGVYQETPYGEIWTTLYKCPCGQGTIELTIEDIPGYRDFYVSENCPKCKQQYQLLWGRGVSPGGSPMIRRLPR